MQTDVVRGAEGERAADAPAEITEQRAGFFEFREEAARSGQERAAGLGQADLASDPIEQADLQAALERRDASGYRRLREVQ